MTAERAEGLISPWKAFLVILALFLLFFKNIHFTPNEALADLILESRWCFGMFYVRYLS